MKNLSIYLGLILIIALGACNTSKKAAVSQQAYMEDAYSDIKITIPEAEVILLKDTIKVLFPENLLFKLGKANIEKDNYPLLERFSVALNKYNTTSILISGYTDNSGEEEVNDVLSKNRALNAQEILTKYNVDPKRMYTWGRGSRSPIASNKTAEGSRRNRRVEFIILYSYTPTEQK